VKIGDEKCISEHVVNEKMPRKKYCGYHLVQRIGRGGREMCSGDGGIFASFSFPLLASFLFSFMFSPRGEEEEFRAC
jgi:hypothetical protein